MGKVCIAKRQTMKRLKQNGKATHETAFLNHETNWNVSCGENDSGKG